MFYRHIEEGALDLYEYLSNTFTKDRISGIDDTRIQINGAPVSIEIEPCTYLGIIINELITNSSKYAWPTPQKKSKNHPLPSLTFVVFFFFSCVFAGAFVFFYALPASCGDGLSFF